MASKAIKTMELSKLFPYYEPLSLFDTCILFIANNVHHLPKRVSKQLNEDVKTSLFNFFQKRGSLTDKEVELFVPNQLKQLTLVECVYITDQSLEHISAITGSSLSVVALIDCFKITDKGLHELAKGSQSLQKLDLTGSSSITREGIESLAKYCTQLNELDLTECFKVDDAAVASLMKMPSLAILILADCYKVTCNFAGYDLPERNTTLKSLCLRHTFVKDEAVHRLTKMCPDLRILDFSWCFSLTNKFAEAFVENKLEKLFALNIWGMKVATDDTIATICRSCVTLTSLTICDCTELTENSIVSIIAMLPNLHTLNMWGCTGISNAGIQLMIRHGTKLQALSLCFCTQVTDNGVGNLARCTNLKSLQFELCGFITDKTIADLGGPNISLLNFRKCTRLTSLGLEQCIQRCPTVSVLNLAYCSLSNEAALRVIPSLSSLKTIDFSGFRELDDVTFLSLLQSDLPSRLITVKLDECTSISNKCIQQMMIVCTNLQALSLCFCRQLTDDAFSTLGRNNYTLTGLSLGGCGEFGDRGIATIAKYCTKMKDLVIPWNKELTDDCMVAIASYCQNLKTLNVSYCTKITDAGVKEVMTRCRNLRKLDLGYCPSITVSGLLATAIYCKNLQSLRIRKHVSETIATFFEEQMTKQCPNLKIETCN